ncbi:MAG: hypothetical protein Kow0075_15410 [Salibacteraceae bacterium]
MTDLKHLLTPAIGPHMANEFKRMGNELLQNWQIEKEGECYAILEAEFLLKTSNDVHCDPFVDDAPTQHKFGRWYFGQGGADITFGSTDYAGAILIRSVRCINNSNGDVIGPMRVFRLLFEDGGSVTGECTGVKLVKRGTPEDDVEVMAVPRVYLSVDFDAENTTKLKYVFKPYRLIRTDISDIAEKYLAALYLSYVSGVDANLVDNQNIYQKYAHFYKMGQNASAITDIWNVSSRMHRMAMLMGYLHSKHPDYLV